MLAEREGELAKRADKDEGLRAEVIKQELQEGLVIFLYFQRLITLFHTPPVVTFRPL